MAGSVGFIGLGNMGGPMALNLVKALPILRATERPVSRWYPVSRQFSELGVRDGSTLPRGIFL